MKALALTVLVSLTSLPASAQTSEDINTIQFFKDRCEEELNGSKSLYCLSFLQGAAQMMMINGYNHVKEPAICPPHMQTPIGASLLGAFISWANQHTEMWTKLPMTGVILAFQEEWPCHPN